jgi:hypothetical protein
MFNKEANLENYNKSIVCCSMTYYMNAMWFQFHPGISIVLDMTVICVI